MRLRWAICTLLFAGCRLDVGPESSTGFDPSDRGDRCVLVTTTEFRSDGALAVIDVDTMTVRADVTAVHSDALMRSSGGRLLVLNRLGADSIQEIDRASLATTSQRSVGPGSNPWGVVLDEHGAGWVALYDEGSLQPVDLDADDGGGFLAGIPVVVPSPTEPDELAEPLDVFLYEGILYAITQGLGEFPHCSEGSRAHLHAFDFATGEPRPVFAGAPSLQLAACNTSGYALEDDGTLWLAHAGGHRVTGATADDGGLERVNLRTGVSDGLLVDETGLGNRDLIRVAAGHGQVWVAVAAADFSASVFALDTTATSVGETVWTSGTGGVFGLELAHDLLWIVDRSVERPGVVVIDPVTGDLVAGPLDTGFPPFDLVGVNGCGAR